MSISANLVCDGCREVIGTGRTPTLARRQSSRLYRRLHGCDYCLACLRRHGYALPKVATPTEREG